MRKWMTVFLSIILMFSLSACGQTDNSSGNSRNGASAGKEISSVAKNARILITYFTVPEDEKTSANDAIAGASIVVKDSEKMGNTEYVAGLVQETIGGDLFPIETKDAYPLEHDTLVEQAAEEQEKGVRPELSGHVENFDQYDIVILGFPNWWGDLPMPVYSFLEEYDFGAKTIIPFVTHGGSGFSDILNTISELQPDAHVSENTLSLSREDVADGEEEIREWAEGLGLNMESSE
ncbi:MAG: flavodoxin [Eubacteriales bacterium]|nr:flavodoxin [Eubacteriales bacterium]